MRTDPRKDQALVTSINSTHKLDYLPVVRLLKWWNFHRPQVTLGSYYFENLCDNAFGYASPFETHRAAARYFFENLSSYLWNSCADPKGHEAALDTGVSRETKQKIADAAKDAAANCKSALEREAAGYEGEAISYWRRVFGANFGL